jgi:hypothetical protein
MEISQTPLVGVLMLGARAIVAGGGRGECKSYVKAGQLHYLLGKIPAGDILLAAFFDDAQVRGKIN